MAPQPIAMTTVSMVTAKITFKSMATHGSKVVSGWQNTGALHAVCATKGSASSKKGEASGELRTYHELRRSMRHQQGAWFASAEESQPSAWVCCSAAHRQQSGDCGGAARRCDGNSMNCRGSSPLSDKLLGFRSWEGHLSNSVFRELSIGTFASENLSRSYRFHTTRLSRNY